MKQSELVSFIKRGQLLSVEMRTDSLLAGKWVMFAVIPNHDADALEGIELARSADLRTWASLDTAHAWLCTLGYTGRVVVESF